MRVEYQINLRQVVEQITKADRLRMSRPLRKGKARAIRRRRSLVPPLYVNKGITL